MVRIPFRARILCDCFFMEWTLKHTKKAQIMSRLIRIKSNSEHHKGEHNVILDFDFNKIRNLTKEHYLRASVKEISLDDFLLPPDFFQDCNEVTKRVICAILLTSEHPYRTYIFTSPEKRKEYEQVKEIKNMISVRVKAGEDALEIIDEFHREFLFAREKLMRGS